MFITAFVIIALILVVYLFMQQPKFGEKASGERLQLMQTSPNYKDGKFQNLSYTPDLAEGTSYYTVMKDFFFKKSDRNKPIDILPSKKTNLKALTPGEDIFVWFGHSSYFMQIDGKKFLVDPVLSGSASPLKFTTRSFPGSDIYTPDDIPEIDYLFISHDHWDHLDYETIIKLKPKIKRVITGLGVGAHFERWGFDMNIVTEKNWNEEIILEPGFVVNTAPTRHFAGRTFKRNVSLWSSFVLKTPSMKIYLGGDSGYDTHFAEIGNTYGPFDLAILECGQYNEYWKYIHMMPEQTAQACEDLKAKKLLPVHWAKFSLSLHAWDDSIKRVTAEASRKNIPVIHPMIGEEVDLKNPQPTSNWWENVE